MPLVLATFCCLFNFKNITYLLFDAHAAVSMSHHARRLGLQCRSRTRRRVHVTGRRRLHAAAYTTFPMALRSPSPPPNTPPAHTLPEASTTCPVDARSSTVTSTQQVEALAGLHQQHHRRAPCPCVAGEDMPGSSTSWVAACLEFVDNITEEPESLPRQRERAWHSPEFVYGNSLTRKKSS